MVMGKKIYILSCIWFVSACVSYKPIQVPNAEKIHHPDIAIYHVNSGTGLDSLLKSEIQEDAPLDIHILASTSSDSNTAIIYLTDQGCVPSFFINAPPLIGYCTYQMHSCFIYGVSETISTGFAKCLTRDLIKRIAIDSVPACTTFSSCTFKRVTFSY